MNEKYEDMLYLEPPVSKIHRKMSISERAAQFMPFAALTGYEDLIRESSRITQKRIELSETEIEELKNNLEILHEHEKEKPMIKVMYFLHDLKKNGGSYQTVEKQLHRIDDIERKIIFKDRTTIQFDDIISVEYEGF
ncbi:hypothetical protein [Solobacterium sp.]|uniref:hypothetical protein n=1 Tax=Solobacterium sp. TaxID=2060878 RepID=UPI001CAD00B4|nr:hypothetical protein [Solobacterium sp.]MBF1086455.1 hypothetical protein [Solobacterium sp.]MBF1107523.1 hypothetical protein [Solobacterium sp.]MBF1110264.1 hypothetical protein [Solobacterium sp.]